VRYFAQRLLQLIIVFVLVSFSVLVIMRLGTTGPRDLATRVAAKPLTDAEASQIINDYRLDQNYFVQYGYWLKGLFVDRDLGFSLQASQTVTGLLGSRMWTTILLGTYAIVFGLLIAVPLGVWQAYRRDRLFDRTTNLLTFVGVGIPAVVLGVFLRLLLVGDRFPAVGDKVYPWQNLGEHFNNFFLPALTLVLPTAAVYARLLRSDMAQTLQNDFITLATAKGMSPQRVLWRHALRNSLLSIVTAVGTQVGALVGSAIVVETLFDLDGLGTQLIVSVLGRDLFTVQSFVAIIVLLVVVVNLLVDLSYALIDPRIRQSRKLA
jgi:peptide/nickel transport system permease protein